MVHNVLINTILIFGCFYGVLLTKQIVRQPRQNVDSSVDAPKVDGQPGYSASGSPLDVDPSGLADSKSRGQVDAQNIPNPDGAADQPISSGGGNPSVGSASNRDDGAVLNQPKNGDQHSENPPERRPPGSNLVPKQDGDVGGGGGNGGGSVSEPLNGPLNVVQTGNDVENVGNTKAAAPVDGASDPALSNVEKIAKAAPIAIKPDATGIVASPSQAENNMEPDKTGQDTPAAAAPEQVNVGLLGVANDGRAQNGDPGNVEAGKDGSKGQGVGGNNSPSNLGETGSKSAVPPNGIEAGQNHQIPPLDPNDQNVPDVHLNSQIKPPLDADVPSVQAKTQEKQPVEVVPSDANKNPSIPNLDKDPHLASIPGKASANDEKLIENVPVSHLAPLPSPMPTRVGIPSPPNSNANPVPNVPPQSSLGTVGDGSNKSSETVAPVSPEDAESAIKNGSKDPNEFDGGSTMEGDERITLTQSIESVDSVTTAPGERNGVRGGEKDPNEKGEQSGGYNDNSRQPVNDGVNEKNIDDSLQTTGDDPGYPTAEQPGSGGSAAGEGGTSVQERPDYRFGEDEAFDESTNSHFLAYMISVGVVVAAVYVAFHNRQKLIGLIVEGRISRSSGGAGRRRSGARYQKLVTVNDEEDPLPRKNEHIIY